MAVGALLVMSGCSWFHKKSTIPEGAPVFKPKDDYDSPAVRSRIPSPSETQVQTPLTPPAAPATPVAAGTLPLLYIASGSATVRVVDQTDQQTLLTQAVAATAIIAVDERGISIAGQRVMDSALPSDHRYAIFLDADAGANVFENGVIRPGVPGLPTTRGVER